MNAVSLMEIVMLTCINVLKIKLMFGVFNNMYVRAAAIFD